MKLGQVLMGPVLCAILAASGAAQAAPLYTVTVIAGAGSAAFNLNNLGQVVGQLDAGGGGYHAFVHDGSTLTDIGALTGGNSVAAGINDSGVVVGTSGGTGVAQAFSYAGGVLSGFAWPAQSFFEGINNAGVIVGVARYPDENGSVPRAITVDQGVVTNLGLLPGTDGEGSYGHAINSAGKVVGTVEIAGAPNRPSDAFLYADGVMQDLGNGGGPGGNGWSINDHDQVVGAIGLLDLPGSTDGYPFRAFLWEAGVLRDLGALVEGGSSSARDINNFGEIVGVSDTVAGYRPFLYLDGAMYLLETLIDPASGWSLLRVDAINDLHQIAGTACKDGLCHAVRLDLASAVPEPVGLFLLGAGLLVIAFGRFASGSALVPRTR